MANVEVPIDQPHPCVACGMCCDGTFFHFVHFSDGDDQSLFDDVYDEDGRPAFTAPCQNFDKCCTVYEDRPSVCRGFKCKILKQFEAGKLSYQKTMKLIMKSKADAQFVLGRFPNDQNSARLSLREFHAKHKADLKNAAFRKNNADLVLAVFGMRTARNKFLYAKKKTWLEKLGFRKKKTVK